MSCPGMKLAYLNQTCLQSCGATKSMGTQTARVTIAVGCLMGLCDAFFVDRLAVFALGEDQTQLIDKRDILARQTLC